MSWNLLQPSAHCLITLRRLRCNAKCILWLNLIPFVYILVYEFNGYLLKQGFQSDAIYRKNLDLKGKVFYVQFQSSCMTPIVKHNQKSFVTIQYSIIIITLHEPKIIRIVKKSLDDSNHRKVVQTKPQILFPSKIIFCGKKPFTIVQAEIQQIFIHMQPTYL